MGQNMSFRSSDAKTEKLLLFLKHPTTIMKQIMLILFSVVLIGSFSLYFYLVNDVTILSMDLGDGSQISQNPERLIELNRHSQLENTDSVF